MIPHNYTGGQASDGFAPDIGFAPGDVIGYRIWHPQVYGAQQANPEHGISARPGRILLRSLYRQTVWGPDENKAYCLTSTESQRFAQTGQRPDATRHWLRTAECLQSHDHTLDDIYKSDDPRCNRPHLTGIDPEHGCGFYAYTLTEDNPYLRTDYGLHIEGVIQGYGRCVLGTKGFRCSRARIIALLLPAITNQSKPTDEQAAIIERCEKELPYEYPRTAIFRDRERMLAAYPPRALEGPAHVV